MVKTVVVDSSIVIKWFVVESYSTEAFHLLDRYQNGELTLLAPDLLYAEIGNIVWKKHRLQGISTTDAQQIIETFCQLSIELTPTASLLKEAYSLAVTYQCTVYDSLYLALSLREQCPLVTADFKLVKAIESVLSNVMYVTDWPHCFE